MKQYDVTRKMHFKSPQGVCVHVVGVTYTSNTRPTMIESLWYEARNPSYQNPDPAKRIGMVAYFPEMYRRYSEDAGRTWQSIGEVYTEDGLHLEGKRRYPSAQYFDADTGLLVAVYMTYETYANKERTEVFNDAGIWSETRRMRYEISRDAGRTWEPSKPLVHKGGQYDEIHWGPDFEFGKSYGAIDRPHIKLADGTMLASMTSNLQDGNNYQVALAHARWTEDVSDVEWEFSEYIKIPLTKSSQGLCEADMIELADGRILVTMRGCGDREKRTFPSLKFYSISSDGGWTFSEPRPIAYEDGSMVWTPSSYHSLFRSSKNGRLYFLANILDEPTYDSEPRWPLCIAEVDEERICIIKETVGLVQGLPDDLSPELREAADKRTKGVRYSNYTQYEDRDTQELVLLMATQPNISWEDWTADNYEYRITIPD